MVGWTIGITIWVRSKHDGACFGFNLCGVKMSGDFAQTLYVRKLIASWLMRLCWQRPTRGDRLGDAVGGRAIGRGRQGAHPVIAGTLPGILLRVNLTCDHFVVFKRRFFVRFGTVMIGGASVIQQRGKGVITLCSSGSSGTLCSKRATRLRRGSCWGSLPGSIHSWSGCVTMLSARRVSW